MDSPITIQTQSDEQQINVALLVDNDYLYRFRSIFSHMLVGLVDQPINVTLVCSDPPAVAKLPIGPAKVSEFKVPFWPWQYKRNLQTLVTELKAARVNLIHGCSGRSCGLAVDLAKRLNVPYVLTFNGLFQEECYLRVDQAHCGRLIGISEPICKTLHELYGKSSDKIELIRPGCFLRPKRVKSDRPKTIVSVGDFQRTGGYDTFLHALAEIQNRGQEFLTIIFGTGPLEHSFHSWANTHGLGKSVIFLEVLANWDEVLSDADFYIQPGPFHSLHSGPYEAMAHGCPLIATKDTAMDLLVNGKTGLEFKPGDHLSLANILSEWLEGKINWQDLSDQALEFARSELSLSNSIEKLISCYRSVLAKVNK
ncbi:MAG: glycosyltransferase family 4 protein [Phycisphaerae bacterium]